MAQTASRFSVRYFLIPTIVIAFLAIFPQLNLWIMTGSNWHGSYYASNYDETAYSAYANSLAAGKSRLNDPFVDRDDNHESLYSIQFIPAYFSALIAKIFGGSTSAAFIFLCLFCAVLSCLALFWLLRLITQNDELSAAGVLIVLCLGTAAAYQGELRFWIEGNVLVDFLPFLRRYQPGFAFGIFFVFCGLVHRSFSAKHIRSTITAGFMAGLTFSVLVFSYFYLWTTAAAWLSLVAIFFWSFNRDSSRSILICLAIIGAFAIASLLPYFYLLTQRSAEMDSVQLLQLTRMPNFTSVSLFIGLLFAAAFIYFRWACKADSATTAAGLAFALTPVLLFNQQIITGRSLQPVHYEIFIANYLVLTAGVILLSVFIGGRENIAPVFRKALIYVGIFAAVWGFVEVSGATGRSRSAAFLRDESIPAIRFAAADAKAGSSIEVSRTMLATNFITSDFIPTVSTIKPLWNPHTSSAGGVSIGENKRLFFMYLYFSGFTPADLSNALRARSFEITAAIFGSERALPALGGASKAVSLQEIDAEVQAFQKFGDSMSPTDAFRPTVSYLMVPAKDEPSLANIDKWYQRDAGTTFGIFRLYKLSPKN